MQTTAKRQAIYGIILGMMLLLSLGCASAATPSFGRPTETGVQRAAQPPLIE